MPLTSDTLRRVSELLQAGKVNEADALLKNEAAAADKEAAEAGKPKAPPPPRKVDEILDDFIHTMTDLLGAHPRLQRLSDELHAARAKK